jgi:hypothetical protein
MTTRIVRGVFHAIINPWRYLVIPLLDDLLYEARKVAEDRRR